MRVQDHTLWGMGGGGSRVCIVCVWEWYTKTPRRLVSRRVDRSRYPHLHRHCIRTCSIQKGSAKRSTSTTPSGGEERLPSRQSTTLFVVDTGAKTGQITFGFRTLLLRWVYPLSLLSVSTQVHYKFWRRVNKVHTPRPERPWPDTLGWLGERGVRQTRTPLNVWYLLRSDGPGPGSSKTRSFPLRNLSLKTRTDQCVETSNLLLTTIKFEIVSVSSNLNPKKDHLYYCPQFTLSGNLRGFRNPTRLNFIKSYDDV